MNNVMILVGAGQIGLAIARRTGSGKTIVIADKNRDHAEEAACVMRNAGFNARLRRRISPPATPYLRCSTRRSISAR